MISNSNSSARAVHRACVSDAKEVAPNHYQLRLLAPELAQAARPGQFVHILTMPNADYWSFDPLLRRAFSIMSVTPQRESVDVLFRVEGRGTKALATARRGDYIDLIGPLGTPFDLSPFEDVEATTQRESRDAARPSEDGGTMKVFHVKQSAPHALLVGGGVGVPPLVCLGQFLGHLGVECGSIIGARSASEVIGEDELSAVGSVKLTTDDGSRGHHGRVTDLLFNALKEFTRQEVAPKIKPIVYSCGPLPMLRAVAQVCADAEIRCQVSLEENMPCGIGVCNGCVIRARQPFARSNLERRQGRTLNEEIGNEWSPYRAYRRICVEGPACWSDEIEWEEGN